MRNKKSGGSRSAGARELGFQTSSSVEEKLKEKLLLYQSLGFVVLIALSWFDECLGLRKLVLGDNPYISDYKEAALEMLFVLAIWFIVYRSSQRLLGKVRHLEGLLHICGWCHRVKQHGRWIRLEEFLHRDLETKTSHGICRECMEKEQARMRAYADMMSTKS